MVLLRDLYRDGLDLSSGIRHSVGYPAPRSIRLVIGWRIIYTIGGIIYALKLPVFVPCTNISAPMKSSIYSSWAAVSAISSSCIIMSHNFQSHANGVKYTCFQAYLTPFIWRSNPISKKEASKMRLIRMHRFLFYCSICFPRNPAADCASFTSTSLIGLFSSFAKRTTAPIISPCARMGIITS